MAEQARAARNAARNAPAAGGAPAAQPAAPVAPTTVTVSVMDTLIPQVPEVSAEDIMARFKTTTLTKLEGEPAYPDMDEIRDKLYRNAMAIKSPFGGGRHGHLGMIMNPFLYQTEAGELWTVAETSGAYPIFPPDTTESGKKALTANFIVTEKGIKTEEVMQDLLRNQVLEAVDPEYYMELEHSIFKYDKVTVNELLTHLFDNYAKIDDRQSAPRIQQRALCRVARSVQAHRRLLPEARKVPEGSSRRRRAHQ